MITGRLVKLYYNYDYRTHELWLYCVVRTVDGVKVRRRVRAPFRPYFYTTEYYLPDVREVTSQYCPTASYRRVTDGYAVDDREETLYKVEVENPRHVGEIRRELHLLCRLPGCTAPTFKDFPSLMKHVKHTHGLGWEEYEKEYLVKLYEADIPFARRVMIDLGIRCGVTITDDGRLKPADVTVPPRLLPFDIEVDNRNKKLDPAEGRVLSIAAGDRWFCDDDEVAMIQAFQTFAKEYDYLYGHNIEQFDLPYLRKRCRKLGITWYLDDWCQYADTKILWQKSHDRRVASGLEYLAETILHRQRVQLSDFWYAFHQDRERLQRRNQDCVKIVEELNDRLQLVTGRIELADFIGLPVSRSVYAAVLAETAIMRKAVRERPRKIFRCRIREKIGKRYRGALILQPVMGLHKNIAVLDFKRLYPRIVRTFNMAIEQIG